MRTTLILSILFSLTVHAGTSAEFVNLMFKQKPKTAVGGLSDELFAMKRSLSKKPGHSFNYDDKLVAELVTVDGRRGTIKAVIQTEKGSERWTLKIPYRKDMPREVFIIEQEGGKAVSLVREFSGAQGPVRHMEGFSAKSFDHLGYRSKESLRITKFEGFPEVLEAETKSILKEGSDLQIIFKPVKGKKMTGVLRADQIHGEIIDFELDSPLNLLTVRSIKDGEVFQQIVSIAKAEKPQGKIATKLSQWVRQKPGRLQADVISPKPYRLTEEEVIKLGLRADILAPKIERTLVAPNFGGFGVRVAR